MTDSKRFGRGAIPYGSTAEVVARNVHRLRKARGYTTRSLSDALAAAGRPILPAGISRVERCLRQVTVDDLVALAVALKVSPSALLLPVTESPDDTVEMSGAGAPSAMDAWQWAHGERPLRLTPGNEQTEMLEYQLYGRPQWLRTYPMEKPA